jgi:hypothetical protein
MKTRYKAALSAAAVVALVVAGVGYSAQAAPHTNSRHNYEGWVSNVLASHQGPGVAEDNMNTDTGFVIGSTDPADYEDVLGFGPGQGYSLGEGGDITLAFNVGIGNGPGDDFSVFDSTTPAAGGLINASFAYVNVSSDGVHFFQFPTKYTGPATNVPATGAVNSAWYQGFAGTVPTPSGDGFDLSALPNHANLNKNNVTQIKLVDVRSGIDKDSAGTIVRDRTGDTWAAGFLADAVGVINSRIVPGEATSKCGATSVLVVVDYRRSGSDIVKLACTKGVSGDYAAVLKSAGFVAAGTGMPSQITGLPTTVDAQLHSRWTSWESLATATSWTHDESYTAKAGHVLAFTFDINVPIHIPDGNDADAYYTHALPYFTPKDANTASSAAAPVRYLIGAILQK